MTSDQLHGRAASRAAADALGRFGLIVTFVARPETQVQLGAVLLEIDALLKASEGCLFHEVAREVSDPCRYWVTEAFTEREAHAAAVADSRVQEAAARMRELLADPPVRRELEPLTAPK